MSASLSRPARLGWHLGLGALVLVVAAWVFGALAEDVVTGDRITVLDAHLATWLHANARPALTTWMTVITDLNSTVAVSCYGAIAGAVFWRRRQWRRLTIAAACIAGVLALNVLVKLAVHRARPVFDAPLTTLSSYSFPSGHVAASTVFYGLGVAWVFAATTSVRWRLAALAAALVAVAFVAFTRMYLGAHYLSDVLAAFAEGVAWLAICLSAFTAFWRRKAP